MHEWINVSVSSRFPEKGRGDAIFGSLNEDRAGGVGVEGFVTGKIEVGLEVGESPKVVGESDEEVVEVRI